MEIIKKYWPILIVGLLLRLILAAFTFHSDLRAQIIPTAVVFQLHQLDFYKYTNEIMPGEVMDKPPLTYLMPIVFQAPFRPLIDNQFERQFLTARQQFFGFPSSWFYLIYAKLPMILFDMGLALLLAYLVEAQLRKKIITVWIFNPFTLWASVAVGQVDVYIAFFIVLSLYLARRNKLPLAALSLGFGGALKAAPFLLLPMLLFSAKTIRERVLMVILAAIPYLLTTLPYLPSQSFRREALFTPQLSKSFYAVIPLSGGEAIYLTVAAVAFIYLLFLSKKRGLKDYLNFSIIILITLLVFSHFHLQWFLWVMPLLIVKFLQRDETIDKWIAVVFSASLLMMLFLFDASLQLKLFAPLFPVLDLARGLVEILPDAELYLLRSLAASIFAAGSFALIWQSVKELKSE